MNAVPGDNNLATTLDHAEHLIAALVLHGGGALTIPAAALAVAPTLVREDRNTDGSITLTVSDTMN